MAARLPVRHYHRMEMSNGIAYAYSSDGIDLLRLHSIRFHSIVDSFGVPRLHESELDEQPVMGASSAGLLVFLCLTNLRCQ